MPLVDLGDPLPLNKVFIAVDATRPALAIVVLFKAPACDGAEAKFANNKVEAIEKAKILKHFDGNIWHAL